MNEKYQTECEVCGRPMELTVEEYEKALERGRIPEPVCEECATDE